MDSQGGGYLGTVSTRTSPGEYGSGILPVCVSQSVDIMKKTHKEVEEETPYRLRMPGAGVVRLPRHRHPLCIEQEGKSSGNRTVERN